MCDLRLLTEAEREEVAAGLAGPSGEPDGWELAMSLSAGALSHAGRRAEACAEALAAREVLRRAARLVGPLRARTRMVRAPLREPYAADLDVESTLANIAGKRFPEPEDWIAQHREQRRHQAVLMIDASLSMAGERMALASVAAAVLALKLHPGDLSVVLFADDARVVSRLGEEAEPEDVVQRMLSRPCAGATHIAAGLRCGRDALARGRDPRRSALLITDGLYTAGPDPCREAARFRDLHVLLIRRRETSSVGWVTPRRFVGEAVARAGRGDVVRVDGFAELPRRMVEVAARLLR